MIKQLIINNFKSIKKAKLNFSKGVNIIFGVPNKGKTNIIRALEFLIKNKSKKNDIPFFARNKELLFVSAKLFDGNVIKLSKTIVVDKEENRKVKQGSSSYYLNKKKYITGRKIPDNIKEVFNLSDINLQTQHENHFLIRDKGGRIAKEINRITKAEKADEWKADITKKINESSSKIKILKKDIDSIGKELIKYSILDILKKDIDRLQVIEFEIALKEEEIFLAQKKVDRIREINIEVKKLKFVYSQINELKSRVKLIEDDRIKIKEAKSVINKVERIIYIFSKIILFEKELKELKEELDMVRICPVCKTKLERKIYE